MKSLTKKTRAYALKNALAYNGKAQQGAVISALFNEGLKKQDVKKYIKKISEIINKVNSLSQKEQKKEFEKLKDDVSERKNREGLPELPDVKKGVVMRFPPSPSGRLHIGHVRTAALSYLYVKKYGGKFYIRIEDTNPETIDSSAYKTIKQELKWLFGNSFKLITQSDRIDLYYKYAEKLIKKKAVYVCTCSGDKFRNFVSLKRNCPCRKLNVKENLERWKKMLAPQAYPDKSSKKISTEGNKKGYKQGEAVLRFKSSEGMKHKNPAMRDFPLARIILTPHPLKKNKYKVWPLMNLAVTVDDIEMKMTHIIRGKDHRDNAERQKMVYKVLGKKYPWSFFIGKYKFKDIDLSKRKIKAGIESGKYSGWDDPKLATVAALKKKYKPEVFLKFTEQAGLTEVDKTIDKKEFFRLLDNLNKKKIAVKNKNI